MGKRLAICTSSLKAIRSLTWQIALSTFPFRVLGAEGYDPAYGALPLGHVIQRQVENATSKCLLADHLNDGDAPALWTAIVNIAGYATLRRPILLDLNRRAFHSGRDSRGVGG